MCNYLNISEVDYFFIHNDHGDGFYNWNFIQFGHFTFIFLPDSLVEALKNESFIITHLVAKT